MYTMVIIHTGLLVQEREHLRLEIAFHLMMHQQRHTPVFKHYIFWYIYKIDNLTKEQNNNPSVFAIAV